MADVPTVGGDSNTWGTKLNTFLGVAHETSGVNGGMVRSAQVIYTPAIGAVSTNVQTRIRTISYLSDFTGNSLATAITQIGSTPTTLYIDVATTCSAAIVVPQTLIIEFSKNGVIAFQGGTITFNSPTYIPTTQVFSGFTNSSVIFGKNSVRDIIPQWWGAKGDGTTDDTLAIQAAIETAKTAKIPLFFTANMFKHTGLTLYPHMVITGCGRNTLLHNTSINGTANITFSKGSNINITDLVMKHLTLTGVQLSGSGLLSNENNKIAYSHFEDVHVYLCGKEYTGWDLVAPFNTTFIRCQGEIGNSEALGVNGTYPAAQYGVTIPSNSNMHKYGWYIQSSDALSNAPLSLTFINCALGEGTTRLRSFVVKGTVAQKALNINIVGCIAEAGSESALVTNTSMELSYIKCLNISGLFCERNAPIGTEASSISHIDISNCSAVSVKNLFSMANTRFDTIDGLILSDSIIPCYSLSGVTNYTISNIKKEKSSVNCPGFALDYLTSLSNGVNVLNNTIFKADSTGNTFNVAIANGVYRNGWYPTIVGGATISQDTLDSKKCIKLVGECSLITAFSSNTARDGGAIIRVKPNTNYTISCLYQVADANAAYLRVKTYNSSWVLINIDKASFNNRAAGASYGTNVSFSGGVATMVLDSTALFMDAFTILTATGSAYLTVSIESTATSTVRITDISINEGLEAHNNNNYCIDNMYGVEYWNPGNIADGASESKSFTIVGCEIGDIAIASLNINISGLTLSASVTASNTVTCILTNNTGAPVDLADTHVSVRVLKK